MSPRPRPAPARPASGLAAAFRAGLRLGAPVALVLVAGCGPKRLAVIGPVPDAARSARQVEQGTELVEPIRIDFRWELNEAGSRLSGRGVARVEPPYRARLDLFLDNLESLVSAALVGDELRLPYGARDDVLPPIDLMWGTLGVFRPLPEARLLGGDRLEDSAERLRYGQADGTELHYEVAEGVLRSVELVEGDDVVQWVRVSGAAEGRYPDEATYRNLVAYRELKITRTSLRATDPFDPAIWDPGRE